MQILERLLAVIVLAMLAAALALAQFETAEVLGTVRDTTGAVVPNVTVTLVNELTGIEAKTATDANGNYRFLNVRVGRYTVTAEAPGFSKFTTTGVAVNVGARQRVDMTLTVGAVTEVVEVKDIAAALQTDSSEKGQVVRTEQIVELPLNGRN